MKNTFLKSAFVLFVMLSLLPIGKTIYACWAAVPLSTTVERSHLIVVGKITRVVATKPGKNETGYDIAFIEIRQVLQDKASDPRIKPRVLVRLSMDSANKNPHSPTDVSYKRGRDGIWLLRYDKQRKAFTADGPGQSQPLSKESEIRKIISQQRKS